MVMMLLGAEWKVCTVYMAPSKCPVALKHPYRTMFAKKYVISGYYVGAVTWTANPMVIRIGRSLVEARKRCEITHVACRICVNSELALFSFKTRSRKPCVSEGLPQIGGSWSRSRRNPPCWSTAYCKITQSCSHTLCWDLDFVGEGALFKVLPYGCCRRQAIHWKRVRTAT